ncbi:MAG: 4-alpha-glucanotransferase [Lachnospiraceae bacterium]|nr:4-alpha-glucanotransferase [Lachnospiraceae bacterium]
MNSTNGLKRGAGVLMAISSLPSDYGIGTMGSAARAFIDMLADIKMRYWQVLPIGPTSIGNSPYQPISAFAGNNYLIDLDELVSGGLLESSEIRAYDWGVDDDEIDYATMYDNRILILKQAFARFDRKDPEYIKFIEANKYWLDDYVLFRAIKEVHDGREWTAWEEELKNKEPRAVRSFASTHKETLEYYRFCQFVFNKQWNNLKSYASGKGISIIGDVPLYLAHDSADVWANREIFALNEDGEPKLISAMPSDEFSPKGQIWGSPVYNWENMDADGFDWWKSRIAYAAGMYDAIRLDHFIGVVKYYAVSPSSGRSESGRWYKGPSRRFMDAIMGAIGDTPLIVDDAGPRTIVPGVGKLIDKWHLTRSRILVFGWDKDSDNDNLPHNYQDSNIAVYTTTHDTETLAGYIRSHMDKGKKHAIDHMSQYIYTKPSGELSDISDTEELSEETIMQLVYENIRLAYASTASIAIIPIQDILRLGNEARMNAPATVFGNWQWRVGTYTLNEECKDVIRQFALTYRR